MESLTKEGWPGHPFFIARRPSEGGGLVEGQGYGGIPGEARLSPQETEIPRLAEAHPKAALDPLQRAPTQRISIEAG